MTILHPGPGYCILEVEKWAGKPINDVAYLDQKFAASHELTADSIDNVLMNFSIASYDKISPD